MKRNPLGLIEHSGMLAYILWLSIHADDAGQRFGRTIQTGAGIHPRSIKNASLEYEKHRLVKLHRDPKGGTRAPITHTLTPRGIRFAGVLHELDDELRAAAGISGKVKQGEPLRAEEHPVFSIEAAHSWSLIHYLQENMGKPDELFIRMIQHRLGLPANQVLSLRDTFHALGLITLEGVSKGGRGARIVLNLTPQGALVGKHGRELAELLAKK